MIDICVLLSEKEKESPNWKALETLIKQDPAANLITGNAIPGNIRDARKNLYLSGSNPLVTYIDPDDMIVPNAFSKIEPLAISSVIGAYSLRKLKDDRGTFPLTIPHSYSIDEHYLSFPCIVGQLTVFKREILTQVLNDPEFDTIVPKIIGQDRAISLLAAQFGDWTLYPEYLYTYVRHENNTSQPGDSAEFQLKLRPVYDKVRKARYGN